MKRDLQSLGVIVFLTLVCYLQMLGHDWLNWDDPWLVTNNELLKQADGDAFNKVAFDITEETRLKLGAEYLPVRDLSIMADFLVWDGKVFGFLLGNLLLYLGGLVFLFYLTKRLSKDPGAPFFATLLFALHPVHVESVAWVSSRKDVLCLFFFFASLLVFEKFLTQRKVYWLVCSLLLFLLALASKYIAIVLVGFVVMRLVWISLFEKEDNSLRFCVLTAAPFFALAGLFAIVILRVGAAVKMTGYEISDDSIDVFLTVMHIFGRYVVNLIFPFSLSPVYDTKSVGAFEGVFAFVFFLMFTALTGLLAMRSLKTPRDERKGLVLFWMLWFWVSLLPTSQILAIQNKMADRYLLFTAWSFAMLLPLLANLMKNKWLSRRLLIGFVVLFCVLTFRQVSYWRDSESLWCHAVKVEPNSGQAWYQLAVTKRDLGKLEEERKTLEGLLKRYPEHEKGLNNYAINIYRKGANPKGAAAIYEHLLATHPNNPKALKNYGHILVCMRSYDEAISLLKRAIDIDPNYCSAKNTLGSAYLALGDKDEAKQQFKNALECDPNLQSAKKNLEAL